MKVVCTYHACSQARTRHPERFGPESPCQGRGVAEEIEEEVRVALQAHRTGPVSPAGHTLGASFKQGHVLAWTKRCERAYVVRVKSAKKRVIVTCLPAKVEEAAA